MLRERNRGCAHAQHPTPRTAFFGESRSSITTCHGTDYQMIYFDSKASPGLPLGHLTPVMRASGVVPAMVVVPAMRWYGSGRLRPGGRRRPGLSGQGLRLGGVDPGQQMACRLKSSTTCCPARNWMSRVCGT
jgi:hypothetical protein